MPRGRRSRLGAVTIGTAILVTLVTGCETSAESSPPNGPAAAPTTGITRAAESSVPAAVATTVTLGETPDPGPAPGVPVDDVCALLGTPDLMALGPRLRAMPGTALSGDAVCVWTDEPETLRLVIGAVPLDAPPYEAAQAYQLSHGEPVDACPDLGDACLVMRTSATQSSLVVFSDDTRLDLDVPAALDVAVDIARLAVSHLGPRHAITAPT